MQNLPHALKVPHYSKEHCRAQADAFRRKYWPSGEMPVDVLAIAEFDLDLEIRPLPRRSPEEWISALLQIPDKEYAFLEYHANEFAGRLLMPLDALQTAWEGALCAAEQEGLARHQLSDAHLDYLCNPLAKHFAVSQQAVKIRLNREALWPIL